MTMTDATFGREDNHRREEALALVALGPKLRAEARRVTPDLLDGYRLVHETLVDALVDHAPADETRLADRLRERAARLV